MLPSKMKVYSIFLFCYPHYAIQFSSILQDVDRSNKYIFIQRVAKPKTTTTTKDQTFLKARKISPNPTIADFPSHFTGQHWVTHSVLRQPLHENLHGLIDVLWCYKTINLAYGRMWIDEKWTSWKVTSPYISKHSFFTLFYIKININYNSQFTGLEALFCTVWCWNTMDKPGDIVSIFQT